MSRFEEFIAKIPGAIDARFGKNVRNLVKFITDSFDDIDTLFNQITEMRSIDKASGEALDRLGEKYGKKRGSADDDFYRILIKAVIASRKGDATVNGILRAIQNSLGIPIKGVRIQDLRTNFNPEQEPNAIKIVNIQFSDLDDAKKIRILQEQIESIVAAGIRVDSIEFTDTASGVLKILTYVQSEEIYVLEEK